MRKVKWGCGTEQSMREICIGDRRADGSSGRGSMSAHTALAASAFEK